MTPESEWRTIPLKRLAVPGGFTDGDWIETPYITDDGVRLIQTGNVGIGAYKEQGFRYVSEQTFHDLRCTEVLPGDVLISRLADPVGRACLAPDLGNKMITAVDVAILRASQDHDARFIVYLLSSSEYLGYLQSICRGGTRDRVSRSMLGDVRVRVPPLRHQIKIADYLDYRTAELDRVLAAKRRTADLLDERHRSFITHVVTRGTRAGVEMKPSGIPCIGEVPAHWRVERNKVLFREVNERSVAGTEELMTVSHLTGVTPRSEKPDVNMFMAESLEGYKICRLNDLVINTMWAWMGALGVAPCAGIVSPSYNVYRFRNESLHEPAYYDLLYRTPPYIAEINRYSKGIWSSRLRLYPEAFLGMSTLVPPKEEQRAIVTAVRDQAHRDEPLVQKLRESVARLNEYRAALISASVSNQVDLTSKEAA